jgi:phenylalanyl-tRNA synthetase beta chain
MKISTDWLSDYVELPPTVPMLARRLTLAGLEVEGVDSPEQKLKGVVVGRILESVQHPNADKLSVTKVDTGSGTPLQIVCGAKNYKVNDLVPVATVGTVLPGGLEIKQAALRGVDSAGMLCSAKELGLSEESSGLLILSGEPKVGTPIYVALGLEGAVLELNVTPNRADALSHLGVAREVSALNGNPLKKPAAAPSESTVRASEKIKIRVEDPERCPRYMARVVEGVKVGPSPAWMQKRLSDCGVRPISNVVDVTNYVLLEYGQPLHGFDLDKVAGAEIVVRRARAGEKMTTLDGKVRTLDADDLLICDQDKPQVLAGVMGGQDSEVSEGTTRVLLEAAHFQPAGIRRASKRHQLHSESSHRFERGTDITALPEVLDRAAVLLQQVAGGTILQGAVDCYPAPVKARTVTLRYPRVSRLLGAEVPADQCRVILEKLGFEKVADSAEQGEYRVPGFRVDVEREEDLVEEVARVRGYDTFPAALPRGASTFVPESRAMEAERRMRSALSGAGFDEVVNYSFVAPEELEKLQAPRPAIPLVNPLSVEQSVMRTSLFPGLLRNLSHALRHGSDALRVYELGRTYYPDADGAVGSRPAAREVVTVAGLVYGRRNGRTWAQPDVAVDFHDCKGGVEAVLSALGIRGAAFKPAERPELHPRATAEVSVGGKVLGVLGQLHPRAAKRWELPAGVFLFALELDALVEATVLVPRYVPPTKFPAVLRDLAVVVPAALEHAAVQQVIREVGGSMVEDATVFDVYTGAPIPAGHKSLAFALRYRSGERTLTDVEVNEAHARIVAQVTERLGGALRA